LKKKILLVLISIVAFTILSTGCGTKTVSKSELVDIYKKLDAIDFQAQAVAEKKAEADKLLKQIYVEPQLSKAIKYVDDMRANHVRLELYDIKYDKLDVLEQDEKTATVHVEATPRGDYFTISSPSNKLGPLEQGIKYDAKLKLVNNKWFISDVVPVAPEEAK